MTTAVTPWAVAVTGAWPLPLATILSAGQAPASAEPAPSETAPASASETTPGRWARRKVLCDMGNSDPGLLHAAARLPQHRGPGSSLGPPPGNAVWLST